MDFFRKQKACLSGASLLAYGVMLVLAFGGCGDQSSPTTRSSVAGTGRLRVEVKEFVSVEEDGWENFGGVYKCIVVDPFKSDLKRGQSINIVARTDGVPAGLAMGSTYVIVVQNDLPTGWESIAEEYNDPRLGMVALQHVEQAGQ